MANLTTALMSLPSEARNTVRVLLDQLEAVGYEPPKETLRPLTPEEVDPLLFPEDELYKKIVTQINSSLVLKGKAESHVYMFSSKFAEKVAKKAASDYRDVGWDVTCLLSPSPSNTWVITVSRKKSPWNPKNSLPLACQNIASCK